jgi:signal transduction histidine kinase
VTEAGAPEAEARAAQRRIIEAADASRARLTRDLHDGAQQHLVNTVLCLRRVQQSWSEAPEEAQQLLTLALEEAQNGIDGLRELVTDVYPAILTTRGLPAALDALAARLPFRIDLDLAEVRLPAALEAGIYFFCADALAAMAEHGRIGSASVTTVAGDQHLTMEVRDTGTTDVGPAGAGWLTALHDRVAAFDGELTITIVPSLGMTLMARFPSAS